MKILLLFERFITNKKTIFHSNFAELFFISYSFVKKREKFAAFRVIKLKMIDNYDR